MKGILAFDQMHDVTYVNLDAGLEAHLVQVATNQGLMATSSVPDVTPPVSIYKTRLNLYLI